MWPHLGLFKVGNRARRHAKTNPGDIKGLSQYKPLQSQRQFCHVDRSLLARRRATFGMATGRYYFIRFYYLLFSSPQPVQCYFEIGFRHFFPFPYCFLRNLKLSLSFNIYLKRNLVLASPTSLLARRRVTFGTLTGHFWHVDGPQLIYSFLFSSPQPVQYFFLIFQPAARPILLCFGIAQVTFGTSTGHGSLLARRRVTFGTSTGHSWHVDGPLLFSSPQPICPFSLLLPKETETFSLLPISKAKEESCFGIAQVTFGTSTGHFGTSTGSYYFAIYYFPARSPSNTTLTRILQLFPFSLFPTAS